MTKVQRRIICTNTRVAATMPQKVDCSDKREMNIQLVSHQSLVHRRKVYRLAGGTAQQSKKVDCSSPKIKKK